MEKCYWSQGATCQIKYTYRSVFYHGFQTNMEIRYISTLKIKIFKGLSLRESFLQMCHSEILDSSALQAINNNFSDLFGFAQHIPKSWKEISTRLHASHLNFF